MAELALQMILNTLVRLHVFVVVWGLIPVIAVKFARQNGVHVSPTVLWDGLIANQISSSWGEKEWSEFLAKNVVV